MTNTPESQPNAPTHNTSTHTIDDTTAGRGGAADRSTTGSLSDATSHGPFNISEQEIYERLHRLRRDVPSSAILDQPPRIPELTGRLTLRMADPTTEDPKTVSRWMNRPHLVETWEQPWPADQWKRDWEAKLSGTYSVPLIILLDGEECGYMEIYRPHRDEIGRVYDSRFHDLGFHVAVGDGAKTGHGVFPPLLMNLCDELIATNPPSDLIVVEPDYRNERLPRIALMNDWVDCGERQQRADRRVHLLGYAKTDEARERVLAGKE